MYHFKEFTQNVSMHYRKDTDRFTLVGHTYPHRQAIKELGGKFDGTQKNWYIEAAWASEEKIAELCSRVGGGPLKTSEQPQTQPTRNLTPGQPSPLPTMPLTTDSDKDYSLSDLSEAASLAIGRAFPRPIWITAEIENLSTRPIGLFLGLADHADSTSTGNSGQHRAQSTVSIRATVWKSTLSKVHKKLGDEADSLLAEGQKIRILCQVQLYKDRGQITLNVLDIDPNFTKGDLALQRAKVFAELQRLGVAENNKKLTLPLFPMNIALITADDSRAKTDFLDQLESYDFKGNVLFANATMQGKSTTRSVVSALKSLSKRPLDAIVITRGGGSASDLRWFDDLALCQAICALNVPVIAAIGHHDDTCVAEMVCFERQKTPTAAADFILAEQQRAFERLRTCSERLSHTSRTLLQQYSQHFHNLNQQLTQAVSTRLTQENIRIERLWNQLGRLSSEIFQKIEMDLNSMKHTLDRTVDASIQTLFTRLAEYESKLKSIDPRPWMSKGWTQLWEKDKHKALTHSKNLKPGITLEARLLDSNLELTLNNITHKESSAKDSK